MIQSILNWLYSCFGSFINLLFSLEITTGVTVGSVMIVMSIFLLVVSNLLLVAKRE